MSDYYTLLTNAGIAYETACKANGTPIKLTQMSVGDGNGAVYNPDANATGLRREVWRGSINALMQDAENLSWLLAEFTIPNDVGGWYVREAGIWTDTGVLYAVIKYPESFKPVMAEQGAGKEFYIRAIFQTSNAANVVLSIDDSIVKATRAWVAEYVANELAKLDVKQSVRAAATGPITLRGAQTVDGIAVVAGDSVLVPFQAAAASNGIYLVTNGAWVRRSDADVSAEVTPNLLVSVEEGATYADTLWQLTTNAPITLNVTGLTFEMLSGPTGISPGTYRQVTVDRRGLVIGGSNPTTLAGYGIGDAYTKSEIIASYALSENASAIGMSGGDPDLIYMRRRSDGNVYYLQGKLGFAPVQQGTGVGQLKNIVQIGWSGTVLKATVDSIDMGNFWYAANFDPNSKANWGSTLSAYGITDAYTKAETDLRTQQRIIRDSITTAGFSENNVDRPYMRRESDGLAYYLQRSIGFIPVQNGGGIGQQENPVKIGYSSSGLKATVDTTDMGNLWYSGNFDPNSKASWGATLSAYGITDAYTKAETDLRTQQRIIRDSITTAGFSGNNVDRPYMRRESDGLAYYLQRSIGFIPVQNGGGIGQQENPVKIGYSSSGLKATVDATDMGNLWYSGNFDPNSKASWGATLAAYGIKDSYTKSEVDLRDSQRVFADSITHAGFASDNLEFPYMRRTSDSTVYYLQRRLGFTPIEQGGGTNMSTNKVRIGYNSAGSLRFAVDGSDFGDLISDVNLAAKICGLGLSGIGSYAFARRISSSTSINQGDLVAGTNLLYSSTNGADGATSNSGIINVGTWRTHGAVSGTDRTLYQRVN